jgi:hypothetical protein
MRVVTRDCLERVYRKLWGAGALKGGLGSFLGLPSAGEAVTDASRCGGPVNEFTDPR